MAISSFYSGALSAGLDHGAADVRHSTAIVASLLLIFEPNVLAYGSLVMTDVPVTCMLLFAVLGFYLWVRQRTIRSFC